MQDVQVQMGLLLFQRAHQLQESSHTESILSANQAPLMLDKDVSVQVHIDVVRDVKLVLSEEMPDQLRKKI